MVRQDDKIRHDSGPSAAIGPWRYSSAAALSLFGVVASLQALLERQAGELGEGRRFGRFELGGEDSGREVGCGPWLGLGEKLETVLRLRQAAELRVEHADEDGLLASVAGDGSW